MKSIPNFERLQTIVEENLIGLLPDIDRGSSTLYDAMKYTLEAGGKRIRPVLLLLSCEFAGGKVADAIPYACAVEFIHSYSLIHDDLPAMDDDDLRRGKPTNHKVFGEAVAILAGDGLLNSACELMLRDMMMNFDKPKTLNPRIRAACAIMRNAGCKGMIAGQVADIENIKKSVSPDMVDYIHLNKTAAMIKASIVAGAYLGGADTDTINNLRDYGESIGLVFQITDDILDMTSTAEQLGKTPGKDIRDSKITYPAVYGMEHSLGRVEELTERAIFSVLKCKADPNKIDVFINFAREIAARSA
ncbi:MAG: polyprenyl synthetase family protein [Clostridiales Family XIII bacterium]|nr:polyprenyl synthetase family protein [Clostridiales Family XIII bacterium]